MRGFANKQLFTFLKTRIRIHLPWEERVLENESAVVLFQNISLKKAFYDRLSEYDGSLIIFDCGAGFMDTIELPESYILRIADFDDLLLQLERLMRDPIEEIGKRHLNTLIVENISTFYWKLRSLKQRSQQYCKLRDLLAKIKDWYQCNVVVTSWDSEFEKGYNLKHENENPESLLDLTFVPTDFYAKFDHIFAVGRQNYRFKDKWLLCT